MTNDAIKRGITDSIEKLKRYSAGNDDENF